jgi:flagellar biosynthesis component FlhA
VIHLGRDYNNRRPASPSLHVGTTYNRRLLNLIAEVRMRSHLPILLLAVILTSPNVFSAQQPPPQPPFGQPQEKDEQRERMEKEMAKRANKQRQADIQRDAEQLLKLATELKQYVDKSNENVLSMDVVKKAETIEKLAHNIKEKMKNP